MMLTSVGFVAMIPCANAPQVRGDCEMIRGCLDNARCPRRDATNFS